MKRTANTKEIRKALIDTDRTQASIADEISVTRMFVGRVIRGQAVSERAYEAIATACNKTVDELFPRTVTQ
jgi:transcriptional regulator with XRE-family HTH domain